MRLINADILLKVLQEQQKIGSVNDSRGRAKAILEVIHAPTVDAEPVKYGAWRKGENFGGKFWDCSVCNVRYYNVSFWKYCPNCGARMTTRKGRNNDA